MINTTAQELHSSLNQFGYICDYPLAVQTYAALNTKPMGGAFLFGQAGTGKTFLPEVLTTILDTEQYFYQCFPGTREDDLLVQMLPDENTVSGIALFDGEILKAIQASHNKKPVILILDEWDKTRPSADSFLLDFLQHGRVNHANKIAQANMENLYIFITMNDERELSEPLLRRLPKIDFALMHPQRVKEALLQTHDEHGQLENVITLYRRCVMAGMDKPATVQELRQLLDAITALGEAADWNTLVYQFVTKTRENQMLLTEAESMKLDDNYSSPVPKLNTEKYQTQHTQTVPESDMEEGEFEMPKLALARGFDDSVSTLRDFYRYKPYGILRYTKDMYNAVVKAFGHQPRLRAHSIGEIAEVRGNYIVLKKPIRLTEWYRAHPLFYAADSSGAKRKGSLCFIEDGLTWEDMKELQQNDKLKITKFSQSEILGRGVKRGIEMRWKYRGGKGRLEIVIPIGARPVLLQSSFGVLDNAAKDWQWLGFDNRQKWVDWLYDGDIDAITKDILSNYRETIIHAKRSHAIDLVELEAKAEEIMQDNGIGKLYRRRFFNTVRRTASLVLRLPKKNRNLLGLTNAIDIDGSGIFNKESGKEVNLLW